MNIFIFIGIIVAMAVTYLYSASRIRSNAEKRIEVARERAHREGVREGRHLECVERVEREVALASDKLKEAQAAYKVGAQVIDELYEQGVLSRSEQEERKEVLRKPVAEANSRLTDAGLEEHDTRLAGIYGW